MMSLCDDIVLARKWQILIRYGGLLRHCVSRNDERVGHPHPIGIAVPGDSYVATLL